MLCGVRDWSLLRAIRSAVGGRGGRKAGHQICKGGDRTQAIRSAGEGIEGITSDLQVGGQKAGHQIYRGGGGDRRQAFRSAGVGDRRQAIRYSGMELVKIVRVIGNCTNLVK